MGGFAVILHGYARTTGDMDIWVERIPVNYRRIKKAFLQFGMPVFDMTENNFLSHPNWEVFTFGIPPVAIDLMVTDKELEFEACFTHSKLFEDEGLKMRTISLNNLLLAKKNAGRAKDINDIENLPSADL